MRVCVLSHRRRWKAGVRPRPESQETCHNAVMDCSPGRVSGIGDFCVFPYLFRAPASWLGVCPLLCLCVCPGPRMPACCWPWSASAPPTALAAARRHLAQHPQDRVLLRTPAQWQQTSAREQDAWLRSADSVLAVAVFGDAARALKTSLARSLPPQVRHWLLMAKPNSLPLARGDKACATPPELRTSIRAAARRAQRRRVGRCWRVGCAAAFVTGGKADNAAALFVRARARCRRASAAARAAFACAHKEPRTARPS